MSSTTISPTAAYIAHLQYTSGQITLSMSIIIILSGMIGNTLNCVVFAQSSLRSKPCVVYFLLASILNLISIFAGIGPRALLSFFGIPDQTETNSIFCKLRLVVLFTTRTISSWLLALATVDRYLISSPKASLRQISTLKNTYLAFLIVTIISILVWAESIYCFDANLVGTPQKCYAKSDSCRVFNDLSQSFVTTIFPAMVMLIAGLMTISNVKKSHKVGQTSVGVSATQNTNTITTNNNNRQRKKDERSLTIMLFAQVILLTIFTLPQAGQKFYLTYSFYHIKSSSQRALEALLFNFVLLLTFIPSCIPFYIYTITGTVFRRTLLNLIKKVFCPHHH